MKSAGKTLRQVANADKVVAVGATNESDGADVDAPLYTFVVPSNEWSSRITRDVPFPEPLTAVNPETGALGPAYSAQLQFYLGAAGTGAPIHYHGPAINSLAYGEKVGLHILALSCLEGALMWQFVCYYRNGLSFRQTIRFTQPFQP